MGLHVHTDKTQRPTSRFPTGDKANVQFWYVCFSFIIVSHIAIEGHSFVAYKTPLFIQHTFIQHHVCLQTADKTWLIIYDTTEHGGHSSLMHEAFVCTTSSAKWVIIVWQGAATWHYNADNSTKYTFHLDVLLHYHVTMSIVCVCVTMETHSLANGL